MVTISTPFLDTDGYWKFTVEFPSEMGVASHTYFYPTKAELDTKLSLLTSNKTTVTDTTLPQLNLEYNK